MPSSSTSPLNVQRLAHLKADNPAKFRKVLDGFSEQELAELDFEWELFARPNQLPPEGDWWTVWGYIAGRGAGKTRSGAEWTRRQVKAGFKRIGMIGPTASDVRDVMVEGVSGILSVCWEGDEDDQGTFMGVPEYQPSKRRVVWANGAVATLFSAEEPNRLRGPQHEAIWCDELAAWPFKRGDQDPSKGSAWDMAMFGLRMGIQPRAMVTTTPRPIPVLRALMADPTTVITRESTTANPHISRAFLDYVQRKYGGTRLGRQELEAELLTDVPGALWTLAMIEQDTVMPDEVPKLKRIVIGVDPSGASGEEGESNNAIGIVAVGLGYDNLGYVLADATFVGSPQQWGSRVVQLYHSVGEWGGADCIVAEQNFGGAMVEFVIRSVDRRPRYKAVTASRGKAIRAEPIAALSEQRRIKFVGANLNAMADELTQFTAMGYVGTESPNRADAMIWAATELLLGDSTYTLAHINN